jgi:hypothetical protein
MRKQNRRRNSNSFVSRALFFKKDEQRFITEIEFKLIERFSDQDDSWAKSMEQEHDNQGGDVEMLINSFR